MTDLIKISKESINGVLVNTVNARELHKALELKRDFNAWMKDTKEILESYEEGIDYIRTTLDRDNAVVVVKQSLNLKGKQCEYIMTFDMCKHISMMSKSKKGKEVRNHFIQLEKESNKVLTLPEQIQLIAQGYEAQNTRLQIVEHKIDNEILLTSAQKHNLKSTVSRKVYDLKSKHSFSDDFIKKGFMRVWKKLKTHFVVSSYMEIPKVRFDEAVQMVQKIEMEDLI